MIEKGSILKLTPKTHAGKNKLAEAGSKFWTVLRVMDKVQFSRDPNWALVRPVGDDSPGLSRWINMDCDFNFEIEELIQ